jgi:glycosyltransferase involved in cell wall biosynthesis
MSLRAPARVLHLIPSMNGGGAEKQLALLAAALPAQGWEVHVGLLNRGIHYARLQGSGATIHQIPHAGPYDPLIPLRIARLLRTVGPRIVQTWLPLMDVAGGVAATLRGVPWIVSERVTYALPRSLKRTLRNAVIARATAVVSNSEEALHPWRVRHPGKPLFHVPNALALDEITETPRGNLSGFAATPRSRIVLAAGRLVAQKNFETLRTAMLYVAREMDVVAVICGIGPQREVLLERIERDGQSGRVLLPGYTPEVISWMKAADAVVSVSLFEGRPNVVMEAMACGTPLVVSDIPEHRELVDEHSALFVDARDAHDVAEGILRVLREREAAAARAEEARRRVGVWTPASVAAQYAQIYAKLSGQS